MAPLGGKRKLIGLQALCRRCEDGGKGAARRDLVAHERMVEDALHRNGFVCIGVDLLVPEFGFGQLRVGPASQFKAFQARHCDTEVRLHRRNADAHRGDLWQCDEFEDAIGSGATLREAVEKLRLNDFSISLKS